MQIVAPSIHKASNEISIFNHWSKLSRIDTRPVTLISFVLVFGAEEIKGVTD